MLRPHDVVCTPIGLAGDDSHLRDRGLGVGIDELRAPTDDPVPLLRGTGQEAGNIDQGDYRNVERVARPDEACRLLTGIDVEGAGEMHRLVGDDAHRTPVDPSEAADHVLRELGVDLEEVALVEHVFDHRVHVVRGVGRVRDEHVQLGGDLRLDIGHLGEAGRVGHVVRRQERQQCLGGFQAVELIRGLEVGDTAAGVVGVRAAQLLHADVLAGHGLDDVRAGDEHVAGFVDHQREVGDGGGVDGTAGTRTHDQ